MNIVRRVGLGLLGAFILAQAAACSDDGSDLGRGLVVVAASDDIPGTLPGQATVNDDGSFRYEIELGVPPGTAGMTPHLSLAYSSSADSGFVGMGFSLSGLSGVYRCPKTLAQDGQKALERQRLFGFALCRLA